MDNSKLRFEKFLSAANKKYNNKFDYSKFNYISIKDKGIIICPIHGEFKQSPRDHLRFSHGCPKCKKEIEFELRKDKFFEDANSKHNNLFDYSEFDYKNCKTKSTIICPKHGRFQQTPEKHLIAKNPCPICSLEEKRRILKEVHNTESFKIKISESKRKDKSQFLEKAHQKFGDTFEYDLSNYKGMTGNKIRIKCKKHGWFEKIPHSFLDAEFGCTICGMEHKTQSKTKTYDTFIEEAIKKHNGKYTYPEYNRKIFKNRKSIVDIQCVKHGIFKKQAQKHLSGQGCFKCRVEEMVQEGILSGGYCKELFDKNKDIANKPGFVYYIKLNDGEYYKIGITINLEKRIKTFMQWFSNVEIIYTNSGRLEEMYNIEQSILEHFAKYRVFTKETTELFDRDISKQKIFKELFNNKSENKVKSIKE